MRYNIIGDYMKEMVKEYIINNYTENSPILNKEIRDKFPEVKDGTIRQILRRLRLEGFLIQSGPGTFFMPREQGVLSKAYITPTQISNKRYLFDNNDNVIGYETGFNFANKLGLTSQTSPQREIISNVVSNRKRKINIGKMIIDINSPKVKVNNNNYKLLQVLDILNDFEKYSEYDIFAVKENILNYLKNIKLTLKELNDIVSKYPLKAQLNFYKVGGQNVIT